MPQFPHTQDGVAPFVSSQGENFTLYQHFLFGWFGYGPKLPPGFAVCPPAPSTGTVTPLVTAGLAQAGLLVAFLATWATWHGQQPQHFEQESVLLGETSQEKVGTTRTFTCVGKIRHILLVHLPGALELRHGDTCNSKDKTGHGLGQINNLRRSMSQRASGRVPGHGSGTSARRESRKDKGERRSTRPCTLTNTFLHI